MQVTIEKLPSHSVLRFKGPIHVGESVGKFYATLMEMMNAGVRVVLLDFSEVDYIDSTGIGELVGFLVKFQKEQGRIALVNPQDRVLKLLEIAGLDRIFTVYPDLRTARETIGLQDA